MSSLHWKCLWFSPCSYDKQQNSSCGIGNPTKSKSYFMSSFIFHPAAYLHVSHTRLFSYQALRIYAWSLCPWCTLPLKYSSFLPGYSCQILISLIPLILNFHSFWFHYLSILTWLRTTAWHFHYFFALSFGYLYYFVHKNLLIK